MSCLRWWWSEHLTSAREESSDREPRKWRPSVSLIPHQSQSQAALSFIHEAEMSVLVLRFGREGLVVFKQMKYGYDNGSRIECLVRGLKTITYDHNNLYIWSCGHWKFTTSVPKVNFFRLKLPWKLTWPWCSQSPCSECGVSVTVLWLWL